MLISDEPYWEPTLHQAATCSYPEGGNLMVGHLYKVTNILPYVYIQCTLFVDGVRWLGL